MANSQYDAGRKFEYKVRDELLKQGAKLVVRSAGSKGPVDLVALYGYVAWFLDEAGERTRPIGHAGRPDLVQVKRTPGGFTKAKRAELVALAESVGARAILASPEKVGRKLEVRLEVLS